MKTSSCAYWKTESVAVCVLSQICYQWTSVLNSWHDVPKEREIFMDVSDSGINLGFSRLFALWNIFRRIWTFAYRQGSDQCHNQHCDKLALVTQQLLRCSNRKIMRSSFWIWDASTKTSAALLRQNVFVMHKWWWIQSSNIHG